MQPRQQLPAVQLDRVGGASLLQRQLESYRLAADRIPAHRDSLVPLRLDGIAEHESKPVERLTEGVPRAPHVGLRPEQRQQRIPPLKSARARGDQVGEQTEPLRLQRNQPGPIPAAMTLEDARAEGAERQHARAYRGSKEFLRDP